MSNRRLRQVVAVVVLQLLAAAATFVATPPRAAVAANLAQDWPTFLHDAQRSGASTETILTPAVASQLRKRWAFLTGGVIAASPTVVGGVVYVGSWDGYEYAIDAKLGTLKWKTFVGQTTDPACKPALIGVTSAAAVANGVVYVGGGDTYWYALDAVTGAVLWKVFTGDNSQVGAHYNWASPLLYNGSAYIGIASNCDAPLVQGQLMQVNLATHLVTHTTSFVPNGQVGGGVWTSPAVDAATNTIFVTTGTLNDVTQTLSEAVVALDATTLAITSAWQLPRNQAGLDSDWGTSPTIFTDQNSRPLVAAANKNGVLYAFNRTNLAAGPVWTRNIAIGGDCPPCGDGSISSGAFAAGRLFYAGGNTTINGVGYRGSVRALDPATGAVIWEHGSDQAVIPAIAYDNGMVLAAAGSALEVLDANTGNALFDYTSGAPIYSAPSVSGGMIFFGSGDGNLYGLYDGGPTAVAADPNCPGGWTCQDIRNPPAGTEVLANGVLTVTAGGDRIEGTGDRFRFISQPVSGDAQITTQLLSQSVQGIGLGPQAGLMMRQSPDATSPFYAVTAYPNDLSENLPLPVIRVWYRTTFGGTAIQSNKLYPSVYPRYMRIQRVGNVFMTGLSADGVNFQLQPGTQQGVVMPSQLMGGLATDSGTNTGTGTATYNLAATIVGPPTPAMTPAPTNHPCPAGWGCQDVGDTSPVGDQVLNGATWTVQGVGPDISNIQDQFHFVSQPLAGDGTISAHFTAQANTSPNAKAGLMLRQTMDWASPYYGILVTPGKGIDIQWRTTANLRTHQVNVAGTVPQFFQLSRFTDTATASTFYTALSSPDGVTWSPIPGTTVALPMTGALFAGIAATANAPRVQSAVTVDSVAVSNTATRPASLCPVGWACTDIGTATLPGAQVVQNGTWTVQAGGQDIWGVYDDFRFMSQPLSGDGTISARVTTQSGRGEWQKTGVMLRYSVDPQAPYYAVFVTPLHGIAVQSRAVLGGPSTQVLVPGVTPAFLEAARSTDPRTGTTYYLAYTSADGINWTPIPGSTVTLQMPGFVLAGIASDAYVYGTVPATLDQVVVGTQQASPSPICPPGWTCSDIGAPTPVGDQSVNGGNWTLEGGGADIWDVADSFRFASQVITADGSVSAHVGAQTVSDPWAKAGVMMRATADPGSPYYAVFVTPGHGIAIQSRSAQGLTSNQMLAGGSVPTYLEIVRRTTTFTAYTSPDRITWTAVPGSSATFPALSGNLLSGVAVTSHNTGQLSSVSLDTIVFGTSAPPPVISAVQAANVAATTATISWVTDTLADSQVDYGTTTSYGTSSALDVAMVAGHSVGLTGLSPNTVYHFQVKSRDTANQLAIAPDLTFTTPPSPCPAGWTCADIGGPTPVGGETVAGGTWTVLGGGSDIWGAADAFQYESQPLNGNGTVSARLAAQSNSDPWAKAGVMMRAAADPAAAYYAAFATPGHGLAVQYRAGPGLTSVQLLSPGTAPIFLQVARAGNTFTAYSSADGLVWTAVPGSSVSLPPMAPSVLAGLAVTSHNWGVLSTVNFDSVAIGPNPPAPLISAVQSANVGANTATVTWTTDSLSDSQVAYSPDTTYGTTTALDPTPTLSHRQVLTGLAPSTTYNFQVNSRDGGGQLSTRSGFTFTTPPSPCPAGWTCADVGIPTPAGSETVSAGTWTVQGGGSDIWGASDAFQFEWQSLPGNGSVSARVVGQTNTDPWAKAGVMVRASADPGAGYYGVFVTPGHGLAVQYRAALGAGSTQVLGAGTAPTFLQVTRAGSTFTAYGSPDGLTWTAVPGSSVSLPALTAPLLAGLAVTSHNSAMLSIATFDSVTFGASTAPPVISGIQVSQVTSGGATLNWNTDTLADTQVNYGVTPGYGSSSGASPALVSAHQVNLVGLVPNTLYHFQVVSHDALGQVALSGDGTFTTATPTPTISAVQASGVTPNQATITWNTDTASDSQVEYGTSTAYGASSPLANALVLSHSVVVTPLASNTTYHFRVHSRDAFGQVGTSLDFVFTTVIPPPPTLGPVQATAITNGSASILWSSSSPTSSQVNYGTVSGIYGSSTVLDTTLRLDHSVPLAGLAPNTTYYLQVVSVDAYGQSVTSAESSFTTLPLPAVISGVQVTVLGATSVQVTWATSTPTTSAVNYGVTTAFGASTQNPVLVTNHALTLTTLNPNTLYHYQVAGADGFGQRSATTTDLTFATPLPAPPTISAVQTTTTSSTTATITWTTDTPSSSQALYGVTAAYGSATTLDSTAVTGHSVLLTALSPNTTYHYQVRSIDTYNQPSSSSDLTFTTPLPPAPVITGVQAAGLTNTGATITWTTSSPSDSQVNYGPTAAYGSSTARDTLLVSTHSQNLAGLVPGQLYHYQVVSTDGYGQVAPSADFSFTTIPLPPTITAVQATGVTNSGATIGWTTSAATTSRVQYGTTTAYGLLTASDASMVTAHSQALPGLAPNTLYHYQVLGTDAYGQPVASADFSFTTLPAPPVVSIVQASAISASTATITWSTSTPASSQVLYGPTNAYVGATTNDPTLVTTHSQTVTGLTPGTLYHFQVFGVDAFGQPGQSPDSTFSTTNCPAGWTCGDVGTPVLAGGERVVGATWTITAGGADIGGTADQFHFDSQPLVGNGGLSARVATQTNTSGFAKAGVMLRQASDPGSPYYAVVVTPTNGVRVQYRNLQGGGTATLTTVAGAVPAYIDVIRSGNTFQAYASPDGATWSLIPGSSINLALSGPLLAGLAVTSHNPAALTTATIDGLSVSTSPAPPAAPCPIAWTCSDVGGALPAGNQSLGAGVWSIQGGGTDIGGTVDQFHFVGRALAADGSISGHLTAQTNTNAFAKAGVMLRQSSDPGSPYYAILATPANGLRVQYRATPGATSVTQATIAGTVPTFLKVSRAGNTFTAYTSLDGSTWTLVPGSTRTVLITGGMLEGLAVTSHSATSACTATIDTVVAS